MEENPVKILLVEDDEDDYFIIEDLLNGAPLRCELDWVDGYEAGLKGVCSGEYDVTLLDYRLGERSGMDLLREALERGCRTPMILLTGQGDYEVDVEAMGSGASDYLVKDQLNEALLERSIRYSIERARTLEALRENEERFRALVQRGSDIITILEADATIRYESPSVERILGYDPEEMVGRNVFEYLHPDDVERARAVLQDSLEKPTLDRQLEVRFRHADGSWRRLEALGSNPLGCRPYGVSS